MIKQGYFDDGCTENAPFNMIFTKTLFYIMQKRYIKISAAYRRRLILILFLAGFFQGLHKRRRLSAVLLYALCNRFKRLYNPIAVITGERQTRSYTHT